MHDYTSNKLHTLADHIVEMAANKSRYIFAIAGAPGSGKSTLAQSLQQLICVNHQRSCQIVAMDGFHLDNQELIQRQLLEVKGAPETFDLEGFRKLLADIKSNQGKIYAPIFDRDIDAVVENAYEISTDTHIILVEGNYLLLKQSGWQQLAQYYDSSAYLEVPIALLRERLVGRWLSQNLDIDMAIAKAEHNDLPNAKLVINESNAADITLSIR